MTSGGVSTGRNSVAVTGVGTAGSEGNDLDIWTAAYDGLSAHNGSILNAATTLTTINTQTCWAMRVYCPKAFTLTKLAFWVNTAINTGNAAISTTVAAGSNGVDVTTFTAGGGSLVVASSASFASAGTFILQTNSAPAGYVLCSYTSKADGTHLSGVTTLQGGTGILATGGTVVQTLNTAMVFNDAGTSVLGFFQDQVAAWGATGLLNQSLVIPNAVTPSVSAGSYVWVVYLSTWTTTGSVIFRGFNGSNIIANGAIATAQYLRIGKVGTTTAYFPAIKNTAGVNTFDPTALSNTNTGAGGIPWVGLT